MALKTSLDLRKKIIYQVFPRQHSEKRNFEGVIDDLSRIKSLGVDIIYLLPIHPIGMVARKGKVGCPYSVQDYYQVEKDLGTLDDLKRLVKKAHDLDMKVIIDMVFNHTSKDSVLTKTHPEWFFRDKDGNFKNRVGDWSDITDINFEHEEAVDYLIDVLKYWAKIVDGFRFDTASIIPLSFFKKARPIVDKVNPETLWIGESVHTFFVKHIRSLGYEASSDSELYEVFDALYDYDIDPFYRHFIEHKTEMGRWLREVDRQEATFPVNYIKLRYLENHDQDRIAKHFKDLEAIKHLTSLQFFLRGMTFIYAGQERLDSNRPSLFEYNSVKWDRGKSIEDLIKRLSKIHKDDLITYGAVYFLEVDNYAAITYEKGDKLMMGYFDPLLKNKEVKAFLKDGKYQNLINDEEVIVKDGKIKLTDPIVIKTNLENKLW